MLAMIDVRLGYFKASVGLDPDPGQLQYLPHSLLRQVLITLLES